MRDQRFVAEHRGGLLKKEQHRRLIKWAHDCAKHVLPLSGETIDNRLIEVLKTAKKWEKGKASVGDARTASLAAIAVAKESSNAIKIAIARSIGHAVATAHMADHSLQAAEYALKAVKASGKSIKAERNWQDKHIPEGVIKLILSSRSILEK